MNALWSVLLLLPAVLTGFVLLRGYRTAPLVRALLRRFRWTNAMFIALIAVSVALGVGVIAQERGLRIGTAQAAAKFPVVVGAPGSETDLLLASVFLKSSDAALLSGEIFDRIAGDPRVRIAAPVAFGDSHQGAPVVGTTAEFVWHLSGGDMIGRNFARTGEVVVGALSDLQIGDHFHPSHGHGASADEEAHEGFELEVVGRMHRTGSPWDRAVMLPIETIWEIHGLANGHTIADGARIGPPFTPEVFPGTPAVIVVPRDLGAAYGLRSQFTREGQTMAFFPGAVLQDLYRIMGDVRKAMSIITGVTQALVGAAVLLGLFILSRLMQRHLAMLRAVGAPRRFVMAVIWSYATVLLACGTVLGIALGYGAALGLSELVTARTNVMIRAAPGWTEVQLAFGFLSLASLAAVLPTIGILRRPTVQSLRS